MKELLKKGYENNYIFYSTGAFASFLLFFFTFKSFSDFMSRQFVEAFSLFLFLSFMTVMILELKTAFFGGNEEELEHVMAEEEEVGFEVEERTEFSNSRENEISNPESNQQVYEWDEVAEEKPETTEAVEKEQVQAVKPKIQKKKAVPIEEDEDAPAEATGFVPESNEDPFS